MRNIYDSVQAFQKLLQTEYRFVLGRKGRQTVFALRFDKAHCFHLIFPESTRDFTERQPRFTLLQKTKIDLATMEEVVLFNRMRCE